jgi:hypothetical protein
MTPRLFPAQNFTPAYPITHDFKLLIDVHRTFLTGRTSFFFRSFAVPRLVKPLATKSAIVFRYRSDPTPIYVTWVVQQFQVNIALLLPAPNAKLKILWAIFDLQILRVNINTSTNAVFGTLSIKFALKLLRWHFFLPVGSTLHSHHQSPLA